ncbi:iron ABC transporter permease [Methanonatronarchaeum sp. AMET-Sl]|uniref:FecCD family ABC transporter permease n=1 Tax=Methanonatronarchaeum sp. AMET-Sl TaxID=3037654 RepID=UPI00244DAD8A|nr:iron ABC transporter permease [Methanonatronarchaeum sp. AMET-Sl]WGI17970.1 iron ABC transporter permease [Methanonatronarchaeum sp. AMET-Sl]
MENEENVDINSVYSEITGKKTIITSALLLICIFVFLIDIAIGSAGLSIEEVILAIFHQSTDINNIIVWEVRLPMTIAALLVGASLSIAGAEMQTILDNPLASPFTLGLAAGAGFGAALAIVMGADQLPIVQGSFVTLNAFFFALIASLAIYYIAKLKKATKEMMILAGIAILFLFESGISLQQYLATEDALQEIVFWLMGSLQRVSWIDIGILILVLIPTTAWLTKKGWKLTTLKLGDERAKGLGINVESLRLKTMIVVSLLTAVAVSFTGIIGFIGLVGPHIARMLVGENQKFFLIASALAGSILLISASIGSKLVIEGVIFPIGILTSIIGVPFFLALILSQKGGYWR